MNAKTGKCKAAKSAKVSLGPKTKASKPSKIRDPEQSPYFFNHENTLFVGNVPAEWKSEDLKPLFEKCPGFVWVRVEVPPHATAPFRPAFVNFDTPALAAAAFQGLPDPSNPAAVVQYRGCRLQLSFHSNADPALVKRALRRVSAAVLKAVHDARPKESLMKERAMTRLPSSRWYREDSKLFVHLVPSCLSEEDVGPMFSSHPDYVGLDMPEPLPGAEFRPAFVYYQTPGAAAAVVLEYCNSQGCFMHDAAVYRLAFSKKVPDDVVAEAMASVTAEDRARAQGAAAKGGIRQVFRDRDEVSAVPVQEVSRPAPVAVVHVDDPAEFPALVPVSRPATGGTGGTGARAGKAKGTDLVRDMENDRPLQWGVYKTREMFEGCDFLGDPLVRRIIISGWTVDDVHKWMAEKLGVLGDPLMVEDLARVSVSGRDLVELPRLALEAALFELSHGTMKRVLGAVAVLRTQCDMEFN